MRRPQQRMISFTAYLAFGVAAWICLGMIARADDGDAAAGGGQVEAATEKPQVPPPPEPAPPAEPAEEPAEEPAPAPQVETTETTQPESTGGDTVVTPPVVVGSNGGSLFGDEVGTAESAAMKGR